MPAERVQIACGPRLAAERLLGRPVLRRPDQHPYRGQGAAAACDPREAKVSHHPPGLVLDQDVRWGQIAMHDTLRVRVSERLRDRCRIHAASPTSSGKCANVVSARLRPSTYPSRGTPAPRRPRSRALERCARSRGQRAFGPPARTCASAAARTRQAAESLIATSRPSVRSCARQTTPIPPSPTRSSSR